MSDAQSPNTSARHPGARPAAESTADAEQVDMDALVAAVERLLRRDLAIERERLGGGQMGRWNER